MDAAAEIGRNPVMSISTTRYRFSLGIMENDQATRDGTAEPGSRDQILRRVLRGQANTHFPSSSADHEQGSQPYCPVDPCSAMCNDYAYIHTYRWY